MNKQFILWKNEWDYSEEKLTMFDIFLSNQKAIKEFYNTLCDKRAKSVTFKVTGNQYSSSIKVNPWIYENMEETLYCIWNADERIDEILNVHHIDLNINWNELSEPWKKKRQEIIDIFAGFTNSVYEDSARAYVNRFEKTYNNELNQMDGLGFGIISNSLASHLIYASMSVKKERENIQQATMNASAIVGLPQEAIVRELAYQGRKFYTEYLEDMLINLIVEYFAYIEKIISEELGMGLDELTNIWTKHNIDVTKESLNITKTDLLSELKINPLNLGLLAIALSLWGEDVELIQYINSIGTVAKDTICDIILKLCLYEKENSKRKIFNKPIVDEDNRAFWVNLKVAYDRMYDGDTKRWNNLIQAVYPQEIDDCLNITKQIRLWNNPREIEKKFDSKELLDDAKTDIEKFFNSNDVNNFIIFCNVLQYAPATETLPAVFAKETITKSVLQSYVYELLEKITAFVEYRLEKQKEYEDLEKQIDAMNEEISHLTFAIFGKKAKRKKDLECMIKEYRTKRRKLREEHSFIKIYY